MRRLLPWTFLILVGLSGSAHATSADRTVTQEETLRLALHNSQALQSAREDSQIALQRVQQSESLFYPRLDLNANWSKFGVDGDTPLMLQPALGPTLVPNNPHQNYYTFRANIFQSVYEGGRNKATWKQARIAYERAKDLEETLQTQVARAAKQAFYDLLLVQSKASRLEQLNQRAQKNFSEPGNLLHRMHFEKEKAQLRSRESMAQQELAEARFSYLRTLNIEMGTRVSLAGELRTAPVHLELQKLLAWASRYRSELRQTEYQQESDALGIRLSLAERTPRVAFGATYERTGYDIDLPTVNWAGTLNVTLPVSISDILFGWAKVKERKAQYRQATLRHSETSDLIEKQVRLSYANVEFWQNEIPRRQEEARRMKTLLGQTGGTRWNGFEGLEAELMVLDAELRVEEAVHGHLWSLATLERAVGRSLTD